LHKNLIEFGKDRLIYKYMDGNGLLLKNMFFGWNKVYLVPTAVRLHYFKSLVYRVNLTHYWPTNSFDPDILRKLALPCSDLCNLFRQ
jgi:hypothetical protein